MKLTEKILNLFFPPKCPFCGKVQDTMGTCLKCEKELPRIPEEEVLREGPGGLCCAGAVWYEETVREALLRLKFQGASEIAEPLGELVARCAAEQFGGEFDIVTWVPVSQKRLRKRGYDQSELLARAACRQWDTQPVRLLEKTVDNPPQSGIHDAAARRANVLGVYRVTGDMTGKRILLIDDICTSGATLTECIRVLEDAGAERVVCVTAALTKRENVHKTATE
jgi:ComF family protein